MIRRIPSCLAVLLAAAPGIATAQKAPGAYEVTATVTQVEASGKNKERYAATVKGRLPMEGTDRAEVDPTGPPWVAKITALETEHEATAKGADGKFMRETCKLAAPIDIPMMAQGSLEFDPRKKQYAMFVALVPTKEVPVNCVNSQSGAHKSKKGVTLSFGTYLPHIQHATLPYTDASNIKARHSLADPKAGVALQMEWEIAKK